MEIITRAQSQDGWFADLSDGSQVYQDDAEGAISAWSRLMERNKKTGVYIKKLYLRINGIVVSTQGNAKGYWHAMRMVFSSADPTSGIDRERHWYGIGFVDNKDMVNCLWLGRPQAEYMSDMPTPSPVMTNIHPEPVAFVIEEKRFAATQTSIIWAPFQNPNNIIVPKLMTVKR